MNSNSNTNSKDNVRVSTETILHTSQSINYGKPIELDLYVVWCPRCKKECKTYNIIDGEERYGKIDNPVVCLYFAKCKNCLEEFNFSSKK